MQTLHSLCSFRDLRAVSPGQGPRRRRPPPMPRCALEWETAPPLPNPLRPTCAVGLRTGLTRRQSDQGILWMPGLLAILSARSLRNGGPCGPVPKRVCRAVLVRQTALSGSPLAAAPAAGQGPDRAGTGLASGGTPAPMPPFGLPAQPLEGRQANQKAHAHTPHHWTASLVLCGRARGVAGVASVNPSGLRRG